MFVIALAVCILLLLYSVYAYSGFSDAERERLDQQTAERHKVIALVMTIVGILILLLIIVMFFVFSKRHIPITK